MSAPTALPPPGPHVAYLVSRFPRLTETFVVNEAHAVRRAGADLVLHPLHRERATVVQPDAVALGPWVAHHRLVTGAVVASQLRTLARTPAAYGRTLASLVRHNWGSRRLLVGAVASFPLAVHLAERFRADGVEHVHAHFATHPAAVAYVVHRLTGIPFSFTAHGSDLHRDQHMLAEKVDRAAVVVAVSHHNRRGILDECGPGVAERVVVVHCGVDRSRFTPRAGPPRREGEPLRVCCIGTLHEVKGQTHLIEACRLARSAGTDLELQLVGDGPDRAALEAQVRSAGLTDLVTLRGNLTHPGVLDVLQRSDVLVVPSVPSADGRREGLPVVVLEAMAVGVPVVASRLSGIPEAVIDGRTGLVAEPGDAHGLAKALTRLAADPSLAEHLVSEAHELVAAEFDVDASARRLVGLFSGDHPG